MPKLKRTKRSESSSDVKKRIIELEKMVAFQEHTLKNLNDCLVGHERQIQQIELILKRLVEKIENEMLVKKIEDETPPPHY